MTEIDRYKTAQQVVEIVPAVMRIVAAELRHGENALIPAHLGVLSILMHHPCNLSELAEQNAVSLPTMSNTISKMVQQGWVKRARAKHDRRMLLIELTPAGRDMVDEMRHQIISKVAELLTPLTGHEQKTLWAGLALLQQAFAPAVNFPSLKES